MSVIGKVLRTGMIGAVAAFGMLSAGMAYAEVDMGSIARGGRLYDNWFNQLKVEKPTTVHALYPAANTVIAASPEATWRCKECHGWDGMGAAGAYGAGKHMTGIKGINGMIGGDPAAVIGIMKSEGHGYSDKLSEQDLIDLANYVVAGQLDWTPLVADGKIVGDQAAGGQIYATVCVNCHGVDGKLPKGVEPLGSFTDNPWETMNKMMNGQPGETMPPLRAFGVQAAANVAAFITTLPAE